MLPPMTRPAFLTLGISLLSIGTVLNVLSMLYARHAIPEYASLPACRKEFNDAMTEWASLFPPHGGQVLLDGNKYDVRVAFVTLRDVFNGQSPARAIESVDFEETEYCLDVLRQTVLCTADITLEPGEVVVLSDGSTDMAATGNHVDHICKDWAQVREFVEKNQESWAQDH
ncbi:uncharacterized protein EV420DRAFT_1526299 [Desarmillaria tabescens]|uniref:Uncharacterized protein n=1 Tax=Armillaria tabescens TaxID=1929756 RepID=A0AA39N9R7_ARMTA|nr:uncharacterized protein EV420DRAFT_1526299 [Desarmillaria tabescens]KAK0461628.1 hypothetical protein EV420DRAFT_1526299 [Desarmillaria tabescens]